MTETQQNSGSKSFYNLTYDLVTLIYEKSKGLETYERYAQDARDNKRVSSMLGQLREKDS